MIALTDTDFDKLIKSLEWNLDPARGIRINQLYKILEDALIDIHHVQRYDLYPIIDDVLIILMDLKLIIGDGPFYFNKLT